MSEYREALQKLAEYIEYSGFDRPRYLDCPECNSDADPSDEASHVCAYHAAKALLARPEPDIEDEVNEGVWQLKLEGDRQDAAVFEAFGPSFEHAAAEKALRNCLLLANRRLHKGSTEVADWESIVRFCSEVGVRSSPLRNDAAEKARELFTLDEWHEKDGEVLWWKFPIVEAPYVGSPLDDDWYELGYGNFYTHWTRIPLPSPPAAIGEASTPIPDEPDPEETSDDPPRAMDFIPPHLAGGCA